MAKGRGKLGTTRGSGSPEPTPSPPAPRAYRRRLSNLTNVRTALADVIRKVESDELEQKKARTLIYGLSVLAGIIQGTDLEERLAALEARGQGERA